MIGVHSPAGRSGRSAVFRPSPAFRHHPDILSFPYPAENDDEDPSRSRPSQHRGVHIFRHSGSGPRPALAHAAATTCTLFRQRGRDVLVPDRRMAGLSAGAIRRRRQGHLCPRSTAAAASWPSEPEVITTDSWLNDWPSVARRMSESQDQEVMLAFEHGDDAGRDVHILEQFTSTRSGRRAVCRPRRGR